MSVSDLYQRLEETGALPLLPAPEERSAQPSGWKSFLEALRHPIPLERRRLNRERREELPAHLRSPQQAMGVSHHACGATHSILERCNFACTSCYLSRHANATKALAPEEVRQQLDSLRAFLGPQGKCQLTAGEVTLLPREVLGSYVEYAQSLELDPMVMTHGERMLNEPEYLEALVRDHGLGKVAIHVDATQRGRQGWHQEITEADLMPLRNDYADLVRRTRKRTGKPLKASHTVTITEKNVDDVPRIVDWVLGQLDAFRMVSFQPAASVGRTEDGALRQIDLDGFWELVCEGFGEAMPDGKLNRHGWHFGHPECNILAPLLVLSYGESSLILETNREGKAWDERFLRKFIRAFGGFGVIGRSKLEAVAVTASLALRNLPLIAEGVAYSCYRLWGIRSFVPRILGSLLRFKPLRLRPLAIIVHKFMSSEELDTPIGRERLDACVFKLPLNGRMVSMCELNGTELRSTQNLLHRIGKGNPPKEAPAEKPLAV